MTEWKLTAGFAVFALTVVPWAALIAWYARWLRRWFGRPAAVRGTWVLGGSLAAYTATCLWLGFGLGPQLLGTVLSVVVCVFGARWLPVPGRDA